jgi:hypothetical protein
MMNRLIGNWTLVSYHSIDPDGSIGKPYGEAVGRLTYDDLGNMSGQVMRPGRKPVTHSAESTSNIRAAYAGYVAYFGRYTVDPAAETVVHHVDGALNPAWVGGHQVRRMKFEGELLILQADIPRPEGVLKHVITWRRAGAASGEPAF